MGASLARQEYNVNSAEQEVALQEIAKATGNCSQQSALDTHQLTLTHAIEMAKAKGNLEQAHEKKYQQLITEHHVELTQARQQSGTDEEKLL